MVTFSIEEQFNKKYPSYQNSLDIFEGEWISKLPSDNLVGGNIPLFDDGRINWMLDKIGKPLGNVLELGPLEGGHSYMLEKHGCQNLLAIESNTQSFFKCLITKEIFGLERVRFLLGDFIQFLEKDARKFDLILASGVLYHMKEPAKIIKLISAKTDTVFFWTHYFDESLHSGKIHINQSWEEVKDGEYTLHKFNYFTKKGKFLGSPEDYSMWMERNDILDCLSRNGFKFDIGFDEPNHPNGPSFSLLCKK